MSNLLGRIKKLEQKLIKPEASTVVLNPLDFKGPKAFQTTLSKYHKRNIKVIINDIGLAEREALKELNAWYEILVKVYEKTQDVEIKKEAEKLNQIKNDGRIGFLFHLWKRDREELIIKQIVVGAEEFDV